MRTSTRPFQSAPTSTTTRSGFSLPIGPVFDIHASLQTLGGLLSAPSSSAGTALDLEALDALELSQKAEIRKILIANGASPEVADRELNSPVIHTILKKARQFERARTGQGLQKAPEALESPEIRGEFQRGQGPVIPIVYEPSLQELAMDVIRESAIALDHFADRNGEVTY